MRCIIPVKSLPSSPPSVSPLPLPLSSAHPVLSQQQSPQHTPAFLPQGSYTQCSFDYYVCDLSRPQAIRVLWLKGRLKRQFLPGICDLSCGLSFKTLKSKVSFANELVLGWKNKPSLLVLPPPPSTPNQQWLGAVLSCWVLAWYHKQGLVQIPDQVALQRHDTVHRVGKGLETSANHSESPFFLLSDGS